MSGDPFLWEVKGSAEPSFLFGTIHWGVSAAQLDPAVKAAFSRSRIVVNEYEKPEDGKLDLSVVLLTPGQSLDRLLSAKAWQEVRRRLGGEVPEDQLKRLKPWFILALLEDQGMESSGYVDEEISQAARRSRKELVSFETDSDHTEDRADRAVTPAYLSWKLENYDDSQYKAERQRSIDEYCAGDLQAFERWSRPDSALRANFIKVLVTERNLNWLPRLESYMVQGGAFVAVGVGHMVGPEGLVALLRSRGYSVSRVRAAPRQAASAPGGGWREAEALRLIESIAVRPEFVAPAGF